MNEEKFTSAYDFKVLDEDQKQRTEALRQAARDYEAVIMKNVPHCRRRSLALTSLEQTSSWAIKAVAFGE